MTAKQIESLQQVIFLSCALTVALTEIHRKKAGCQSYHPSAICRLLSLCLVMLHRQVKGDWRRDHVYQMLTIDDSSEKAITEFVAPTMMLALHFTQACCANSDIDLGTDELCEPSAPSFHRAFAHDIGRLMRDEQSGYFLKPAQELRRIQNIRVSAFDAMRNYRQADWWSD